LREHGVDFIDMFPLFDGKLVESVDGRYDHGETCIKCLGEIGGPSTS
jgi:hypothetical protein